MNPKQPVAFPRQKLIARVHPETLKTLDRERKRRGLGLGEMLDLMAKWLMEPMK